jgi:hypothetical protein
MHNEDSYVYVRAVQHVQTVNMHLSISWQIVNSSAVPCGIAPTLFLFKSPEIDRSETLQQ